VNDFGYPQVNVFPVRATAFSLPPGWFERVVVQFSEPASLLITLTLIASIGILALRRFEDARMEEKVWNFAVIVIAIIFWPVFVLSLKNLIDTFNTYLVVDVFGISWRGFGFPSLDSPSRIFGWSAETVARFIPNLAYWVLYAFFMVQFFLLAVLGPFVLTKGILFNEVEALFEVTRELVILFLWQTTIIVLVAFILPAIVSGEPFPNHPDSNYYFLSLVLGISMLFVPPITRKFGNHLGSSIFPSEAGWGMAFLGLTALGKVAGGGLWAAGVTRASIGQRFQIIKHDFLSGREFKRTHELTHQVEDLHDKKAEAERRMRKQSVRAKEASHGTEEHDTIESESLSADRSVRSGWRSVTNRSSNKKDGLVALSRRAKSEILRREC